MFHIIDIDNTLIYTDILNTQGYLHGLACKGLQPLKEVPRITREVIKEWYPELPESDLVEIIKVKQQYVNDHVQESTLNLSMANILTTQGTSKCALWTAANPDRIQELLNFHRITGYKAIRYSDKSKDDVEKAIQYFCYLFSCEPKELCFYEDNQDVIRELQQHDVTVKDVLMC